MAVQPNATDCLTRPGHSHRSKQRLSPKRAANMGSNSSDHPCPEQPSTLLVRPSSPSSLFEGDEALWRGRRGSTLIRSNPAARPISLELTSRVGVPARRGPEHHDGEHRRERGRDPILIGHELYRKHPPSLAQTPSASLQQANTGLLVEVVQEVGQENQIVAAAPVHLKSAARNGPIPIHHTASIRRSLARPEGPLTSPQT